MRFPRSFFDIEPASGPGYHTDEASSALTHLAAEGLPLADVVLLGRVSRGTEARPNPTDIEQAQSVADADAGVSEAAAPYKELIRLAYLATGQWGQERATTRRSLPLLGATRANPSYPERVGGDFFLRMAMLERATLAMLVRANQRYDDAKRPNDSRPWDRALHKILTAVRFLRKQEYVAADKRTIRSETFFLGLPKGRAWGPIAKDGNQKLPFVAYSELPMATCPGAGECGVAMGAHDVLGMEPVKERGQVVLLKSGPNKGQPKMQEKRGRRRGWCYSFGAWRMDGPFVRQMLNTLANYADREFAILANGGPADPRKYEARVAAAIRGEERREWPRFIERLVLTYTRKARRAGKQTFLRLFVDGDINTEDNIVSWMKVCRRLEAPTDLKKPKTKEVLKSPPVEVYGYSKCWQQFLNVHDRFGTKFWPKNYIVNLSSGSVYISAKYSDIRARMEKLPVSRGYFEAIKLDEYLGDLKKQTDTLRKNPATVINMDAPKVRFDQFSFSESRIRLFVRLNGVETWDEAMALVPELERGSAKAEAAEIRKTAFNVWITSLVRDPAFGAMVRLELARDNDDKKEEASYYDALERRQRAALAEVLTTGVPMADDYKLDKLLRKALAVLLQEVLWTFGQGGSCPLVCGNCSDDPADATQGVHRCAAKKGSAFWRADIHIGIH